VIAGKPTAPVVRLVGVAKQFHNVHALRPTSLEIYEGEFLTLLGPSGCGKTTCLRLIAGFEEPTEGRIFLEDADMEGVPPNQRDVSMVFQDYALFPHMNVFENVAFGLRERGQSRGIIREKVGRALELVGLAGFETRSPTKLSGGQKQRVALARSLVLNPRVLLLDEPLGALDLKLRKQMQGELKALQAEVGNTFVYVTHDQEEALTMSDRIVVMERGTVQQIGTPLEIYSSPKTRFVADFIGETTFLEGKVVRGGPAGTSVDVNGLVVRVAAQNLESGRRVMLAIRPENIGIGKDAVGAAQVFEGRISATTYKGATTEYTILLTNNLAVRAAVAGRRPPLENGDATPVGWDPDAAMVLKD
jgi:spermidine/putrescine transport system ATP-binding protein